MEAQAFSTWDIARTEGKLEGKQEGKIEEKEEIAIKFFRKFPDWSNQAIAEFVGLPIKDIERLRNNFPKKD